MIRERRTGLRRDRVRRRLPFAVVLAGLLLGVVAAPASAQKQRGAHPTQGATTPAPPPRSPVPTASLIPPAAITGLCQCVADHDRRHIGCLTSVDQCKAACGEHYSFVPHAPSCPVTAQERGQ